MNNDLSSWALKQQMLQQMLLSQMAQNNVLIKNSHYMVLQRRDEDATGAQVNQETAAQPQEGSTTKYNTRNASKKKRKSREVQNGKKDETAVSQQKSTTSKSLFPNLDTLFSNDITPVSLSSDAVSTSRKRANPRVADTAMHKNARISEAPRQDAPFSALALMNSSASPRGTPPSNNNTTADSSLSFHEIDMNLFQTRLKEQHEMLRQQQNRALQPSMDATSYNLNDSLWPQQQSQPDNSMIFNASQNFGAAPLGASNNGGMFFANSIPRNDAFLNQQSAGVYGAGQNGMPWTNPSVVQPLSNTNASMISPWSANASMMGMPTQPSFPFDPQSASLFPSTSTTSSLELNPFMFTANSKFPTPATQPLNPTTVPPTIMQVNNINNNNTFIDNQCYTNVLQNLYGGSGGNATNESLNALLQQQMPFPGSTTNGSVGATPSTTDSMPFGMSVVPQNNSWNLNASMAAMNPTISGGMDLNSLFSVQQQHNLLSTQQRSFSQPSSHAGTQRHDSVSSENLGFTPRMNPINALADLTTNPNPKPRRDADTVKKATKKSRKRDSTDDSGPQKKKKKALHRSDSSSSSGVLAVEEVAAPPPIAPDITVPPAFAPRARTTGTGPGRSLRRTQQKRRTGGSANTSSSAKPHGDGTDSFVNRVDSHSKALSHFEKLFPNGKIQVNFFDEEEKESAAGVKEKESTSGVTQVDVHSTGEPEPAAMKSSSFSSTSVEVGSLSTESAPVDPSARESADSSHPPTHNDLSAPFPTPNVEFNYEAIFDHIVSQPYRHNNRDYQKVTHTKFHPDMTVKSLSTIVKQAISAEGSKDTVIVSTDMPICHKPEYAPINHMNLSHDGKMLTTVSSNGVVRLWDVSGGLDSDSSTLEVHLLLELRDLNLERRRSTLHEYYCALFTPDDGTIVVGGKLKDRYEWDASDLDNKILPCPLHVYNIGSQVDNIQNDRITEPNIVLEGHEEEILCLTSAWFCNSYYLLTGSYDGSVIRWKLNASHDALEEKRQLLDGVSGTVFSIQFVPDTFNRFFLTASDKCIRLYDMEHMTLLQSFDTPYTSYCDHLRFLRRPLNEYLRTNTVQDKKNQMAADFEYHFISHGVESMHNDKPVESNKCLLHKLCINREENRIWIEPEVRRFENKAYTSNAWLVHPEMIGKHLLSPGSDGKVYIFDLETGEMVKTVESHYGQIRQILADPHRNRFFTCGDDGQCNVFVYQAELCGQKG